MDFLEGGNFMNDKKTKKFLNVVVLVLLVE